MNEGRTGRQRLCHGHDRRQDFVVDGEDLCGIARLFERIRHDHGHDVADMPHLAGRHGKMEGLAMAVAGFVLELADGRKMPHLVGEEIGRREDCRDTRESERGSRVDA